MKINFNLEGSGKDIAILKNKTTKKEKPIHMSESIQAAICKSGQHPNPDTRKQDKDRI